MGLPPSCTVHGIGDSSRLEYGGNKPPVGGSGCDIGIGAILKFWRQSEMNGGLELLSKGDREWEVGMDSTVKLFGTITINKKNKKNLQVFICNYSGISVTGI